MDTSKQNIKMLDHPLIQEQKEEFEPGDWFAYYESKAGGKPGDLVIAVVGVGYYEFKRSEATKGTDDAYFRLSTVGFDEGDCELGWGNKIIWLPRQDDIQEMCEAIPMKMSPWDKAYWLYSFAESHRNPNEPFPFKSMEQLWLAYYMWEKHGLTWDGKKWTKK